MVSLLNLLAQLLDRIFKLSLGFHCFILELLQLRDLPLLLLHPFSHFVIAAVLLSVQFLQQCLHFCFLDAVLLLDGADLLVLHLNACSCFLNGLGQLAYLLIFLLENMQYLLVLLLLLLALLPQAQAHELLQVRLLLA